MVRRINDKIKRNIALLVFASLSLSCQQLVAQDFTLGIGGGLNIPSLIGGCSDNPTKGGNSFNFGGDLGVYGEYRIIDSYSLSVGLDYSSGGGLYRLKYLLIPLLVKQTWSLTKHTKFYAGGGPFAGILLGCNRTMNPGIVYYPNNFNAGIGGIAGISRHFKNLGTFFLEVGTDYGFLPIQKPASNAKNHMFIDTIKVGYSFIFGKRRYKQYYRELPYRSSSIH